MRVILLISLTRAYSTEVCHPIPFEACPPNRGKAATQRNLAGSIWTDAYVTKEL